MSLVRNLGPGENRLPAPHPKPDDLLEGVSLWNEAKRRLLGNKVAVVSLVVLGLLILVIITSPLWWPHSPIEQQRDMGATAPSLSHPFGTDTLGRDLFARTMAGGRLSLAVGLAAATVALIIGVSWGAIAGYIGGKTDAVMMRIVDILYALPFTVFVILLMTVVPRETWVDRTALFQSLGLSTNLLIMFLAIGAVEWLTMARIVRGQVMAVRKQEFIEAAIALGLRQNQIIRRHVVPNVLGPVIVYTTLTVPAIMLLEAFISFLGLGVQPPNASWGTLIHEGANSMAVFPWMLLIPALLFSLTLFCMNFLGDGLRDALDPRSSKD